MGECVIMRVCCAHECVSEEWRCIFVVAEGGGDEWMDEGIALMGV